MADFKLADSYPYFLANRPEAPNADLEVTDKFTGEVATRVALAKPEVIDQAIAAGNLIAGSVISGNRNFEGRQGYRGRTHLVSPAMAAAAAIAGHFADPAKL